jgi:hypothetical protein
MKPTNWNKLSKKEKKAIAMNLLTSVRGTYLISQAFSRAIEVMKKEKYPETSNIQDMEMLREILFNLFIDDKKIKELIENERKQHNNKSIKT